MLADVALVVAALSTAHKFGLAAVGATFIAFALVSSFLLPRRNPNFPGRHLSVYVTVCVLFFVAMLAAVLVFGREKSEASGNESPSHTATESGSLPGQTTSTPATTSSSGGGGVAAPQGSPTAGKAVFASAGCSGCHTLKAAGATGTIGPNLDQLKPPYARIVLQVNKGGGPMPAFKGRLSPKQIADVAAFVYVSSHSAAG
jgi:mono/diheme cytochrome c family protein